MKSLQIGKRLAIALSACAVATMGVFGPLHSTATAAVMNPTATAKVSFTFDDGLTSALTQAAPTLKKYGFTGTDYAITGCVGMTTAPNTCNANGDTTYMSWTQIAQLQSTYGWEIGSHTVTHPLLASSDPTFQPQPLTNDQMIQELVQSKATLAAHGITATDFAPPYGDYNMTTLAQIAKYYASMRGFQDTGYNTWPNSDYLIRDQYATGGVSVTKIKGYIDTAIKNKQWLVLTFHDIKTNASSNPDDYEYSTKNLDAIAAYVKSKNIPVVNVGNGLVTSDTNLLPNASFNSGISGGWTTDNAAAVTADAGTNGSYPDPTNSVKFSVGTSTGAAHLFSPQVQVDPNTTYVLKNFLNVAQYTSGEVGFYVDEYDSLGNWISGQYKTAERSVFVEDMNFSYKPTSASVAKARLQVAVPAGSSLTAYVDNAQWFPTTTTLPVIHTNLMPNGTFDAGIASGWTTDNNTAITADSANHGSPANPVNSVSMVAGTTNAHLFAPKIGLSSTTTYNISAYVNVLSLTSGEVGFYIDEYDANGNWISGQYKGGVRTTGVSNVSFTYKPTSSSVSGSSLQIILVGNSGIKAYVDDVQLY